MSTTDFLAIVSTLLQVNAGLLGVAVTLISLIPALLAAVDQGKTTFVQNEVGKRVMEKGLEFLRAAIVLFALGCMGGVSAFIHRKTYMLCTCGSLASVGLVLMAVAAFRLARISRFLVGGGKL